MSQTKFKKILSKKDNLLYKLIKLLGSFLLHNFYFSYYRFFEEKF